MFSSILCLIKIWEFYAVGFDHAVYPPYQEDPNVLNTTVIHAHSHGE